MVKLNWNYHTHTNYTDGLHTVAEIAKYCDKKGIDEIAVTEHVRRELTYDFDRLLSDIEEANELFNVRILSGIEARILSDGTLDCTDKIKKKVDIVVGSVHALGTMTKKEAYEKLADSDCMVIGHPQYYNDRVVTSLVTTGKIVELSDRYEQSEEMIKVFRDAGLLFSIGLDSHRIEDFDGFGKLTALVEMLGLQERLWRFPS